MRRGALEVRATMAGTTASGYHRTSRRARLGGAADATPELTEDVRAELHEERGPAYCRTVSRPEQAEILQRQGVELFDDVPGMPLIVSPPSRSRSRGS